MKQIHNHRTAVTETQPAWSGASTEETNLSEIKRLDVDIQLPPKLRWEPFASLCCLFIYLFLAFACFEPRYNGRPNFALKGWIEEELANRLGFSFNSLSYETFMLIDGLIATALVAFGIGFAISGLRTAKAGRLHYLSYALFFAASC